VVLRVQRVLAGGGKALRGSGRRGRLCPRRYVLSQAESRQAGQELLSSGRRTGHRGRVSPRTKGAFPKAVRSRRSTTCTCTWVSTTPASLSAPATAIRTPSVEASGARPAMRTRSPEVSWMTCHPASAAWSRMWWNTMGWTLTVPALPASCRTSSMRPSMSSRTVKERPQGQPRPPSLTVSDIS
jgi:hypothetical protein